MSICNFGHLIFDKNAKHKLKQLQNIVLGKLDVHMPKMKLDP